MNIKELLTEYISRVAKVLALKDRELATALSNDVADKQAINDALTRAANSESRVKQLEELFLNDENEITDLLQSALEAMPSVED